jgi:hypothetical protein
MRLFPSQESETIAPPKKQKDFSTSFQILPVDFRRGYPYPPMYTQFHPRSPNPPKNQQRVATAKLLDYARFSRAGGGTRSFSSFAANKSTSPIRPKRVPCVTLGSPWVTLGRPLGHPIPIPIGRGSQPQNVRTRPQAGSESLVWHSRPRLCVLRSNQSQSAAALGYGHLGLGKHRCSPIPHAPPPRSLPFLH